jgi:hypothetical protein
MKRLAVVSYFIDVQVATKEVVFLNSFGVGFITVKEQCDFCKRNDNEACCKNIRSGACAAAEKNPNMLTVISSASTSIPDEQQGPNKFVIIGIAIGSVFLLMFMGFLVFFYRSVKNSTQLMMSSVQSDKGDLYNNGYNYNPFSPEAQGFKSKRTVYLESPRSPTIRSPLKPNSPRLSPLSPVPRSATKSIFSDAAYTVASSSRETYTNRYTMATKSSAPDNEYLAIIAFGTFLFVITHEMLCVKVLYSYRT